MYEINEVFENISVKLEGNSWKVTKENQVLMK